MQKYLSVLVITAALFGTAGCGNKKKNKAAVEQKETVVKHFVQDETNGTETTQIKTDKKEDYSILG